MRLTERVHQRLSTLLQAGDIAIDATAGNGHDTLFLAQQTGQQGHVYAFDIQQQALDHTKQRILQHTNLAHVHYIHAGHERMHQHIHPSHIGQIKAITFNLGYLPKADKQLVTTPQTTLQALQQSAQLLAKGGIISILAYTAHAGGREECDAIKIWLETCSTAFNIEVHIPETGRTSPPEQFFIYKA